jgi:HEAT repeat protein
MTYHKIMLPSKALKAIQVILLIFLFILTTAASQQPAADKVESLIKKFQSKHPNDRAEAVTQLARIKDARVVPLLIGALKDADSYVRGQTAAALGDTGDKRAVQPLITVLKDDDYMYVRQESAKALGKIKDSSAVRPLINALNDETPDVREEAAKALIGIGAPAKETLDRALKKGNLKVIAAAYYFFISVGETESEAALIGALHKYGNKRMAGDFANCGNMQLKEAAQQWAQSHGYKIGERAGSPDGPKWKRFKS